MDSNSKKRLFKAIYSENNIALKKIGKKIIEEEKKNGHNNLAKKLEEIINQEISNINSRKENSEFKRKNSLNKLPKNKRDDEPLIDYKTTDMLQHHMVLSPEVEEKFVTIEKEYAAKGRLAKYNLTPRKKILLYGPPGCGKTLGAERLAWNTGLTLMKVRFDSIISSYFGESSSNLRKVFESSKEKPYLLLLDECDFIAKSRDRGSDVGEVPRIVNMLLLLLDEYNAPGMLVATTNLEGSLDRALFRRFDDVIKIPRPGTREIYEILKMTLSAMELSKNINWPQLVEQMKGFSAANIVQVAENAAKLVVLANEKKILQKHLEKAINDYNTM